MSKVRYLFACTYGRSPPPRSWMRKGWTIFSLIGVGLVAENENSIYHAYLRYLFANAGASIRMSERRLYDFFFDWGEVGGRKFNLSCLCTSLLKPVHAWWERAVGTIFSLIGVGLVGEVGVGDENCVEIVEGVSYLVVTYVPVICCMWASSYQKRYDFCSVVRLGQVHPI